jgi:hypothetical protein
LCFFVFFFRFSSGQCNSVDWIEVVAMVFYRLSISPKRCYVHFVSTHTKKKQQHKNKKGKCLLYGCIFWVIIFILKEFIINEITSWQNMLEIRNVYIWHIEWILMFHWSVEKVLMFLWQGGSCFPWVTFLNGGFLGDSFCFPGLGRLAILQQIAGAPVSYEACVSMGILP